MDTIEYEKYCLKYGYCSARSKKDALDGTMNIHNFAVNGTNRCRMHGGNNAKASLPSIEDKNNLIRDYENF